MERCDFLPVSAEEMHERGWWWYDALVVGGDAYVDHPSFGTAVISRVLEAEGLRVAVLAQPDWHDAEAFRAMGRPRLGVFIGAGNLDSMVAHYTAAKRRRSEDFYSPGKRTGCRPDRAAICASGGKRADKAQRRGGRASECRAPRAHRCVARTATPPQPQRAPQRGTAPIGASVIHHRQNR